MTVLRELIGWRGRQKGIRGGVRTTMSTKVTLTRVMSMMKRVRVVVMETAGKERARTVGDMRDVPVLVLGKRR